LDLRGSKWQEAGKGSRMKSFIKRHNLHTSPNIIRVNKSRMMRWVGHLALIRKMRN
jgi:hypothetical protein